jgi:hypothetical protein
MNPPRQKIGPDTGTARGLKVFDMDITNIAARASRQRKSEPVPFNRPTDSTPVLVRWLTRRARLSETHAGVVAELAFRSPEAAHG